MDDSPDRASSPGRDRPARPAMPGMPPGMGLPAGTPGPPRRSRPRWSRRRRRLTLAAAGALTAAAAAGLTAWGIANPGAYGQSRDGCVTVSLPSSTGGALQHGCGDTARAMCRAAYAGHDRLSAATRPQCRLAGIGPQATGR